MFWEHLIILFWFWAVWRSFVQLGPPRSFLGCPTACESADGCCVLNLDRGILLLFFTFLSGFGGVFIILFNYNFLEDFCLMS